MVTSFAQAYFLQEICENLAFFFASVPPTAESGGVIMSSLDLDVSWLFHVYVDVHVAFPALFPQGPLSHLYFMTSANV